MIITNTTASNASTIKLTALATPGQPTGAPVATGGTLAAGTNFAKIVALDANGNVTAAGTESASVTTVLNGSIVWSWAAVPGAASYQIWVSATTGTEANYYVSSTNSFTQIAPAASGTSGTIPSVNTTGGLIGTTTNDSAGTGIVGEYVTSSVVSTTVNLTTGTTANITTISLTAGDWDVTGGVLFQTAATTTVTACIAGISTTTGTLGADGTYARSTFATVTPGAVEWADFLTPVVRISIATTTTVYLVGQSTFATSTQTAGGYIRARRVR